ncbi:hypothetical protein C2845_PM01G09440 [Panicum miliaceum]|uniref:Uncharacterized protein n=1 Tax=Panicum miliaceum TaxID=4540 RepID=A0A3L6TJV3_PANMI|nr:hypothetical protein C2845_PM01G09440 [Panicum miliaceum]
MASKSMATPALLVVLAMVLMLAASAHAQAPVPAPAPGPSQSLCPNGFRDIQALETTARGLVDKVEFIFLPEFMAILDSTLAKLGLLHPGVKLCVCALNPHYSRSGMEPKIKCFGGQIIL